MNINEMKFYCETHKTSRFFTEENINRWNIHFEDEPNKYNIFIYSAITTAEWSPCNEEGRTFCLQVFCTEEGRPEGIVFKALNFSSYEKAKQFKAAITAYLDEYSISGCITKAIQRYNYNEAYSNIIDFYFTDGNVVSIDLDSLIDIDN
ncbi:MAG: hypothetical protein IJ571_06080 [Ruminococcus sp.]|nr:hypothetical protein [Ruminococcus sp.]